MLELGADRTGDVEAIGVMVRFDRAPDRAQHARHALPLVEQHGLRKTTKRGIGIGLERRRPQAPVEPNHRGRTPRQRCRLAGRARPDHEHSRQLTEQLVQQRINEAPPIWHHCGTSHLTHKILAATHVES